MFPPFFLDGPASASNYGKSVVLLSGLRFLDILILGVGVIRMIKLFAWEPKILKDIDDKRVAELNWIRRNRLLDVIMVNVEVLLPALSMLATFGTYVRTIGQHLTMCPLNSVLIDFDYERRVHWLVPTFSSLYHCLQSRSSFKGIPRFSCTSESMTQNSPEYLNLNFTRCFRSLRNSYGPL